MQDFVDIRITELLCSRLCHELASPVGAINNGIEMVEEFDDSMIDEAMPLIGNSARMVASRLAFYRMAYGAAGNRSIASVAELIELADAYFAEGRTRLAWPTDPIAPELEDGWAKLLLNMLPLAADTLPRGGELAVSYHEETPGFRISVAASGVGARISDECDQAMKEGGSLDDLTPRSVHAYFVSRLARRLRSQLEVDAGGADRITFSALLSR